ncbi:MAG: hypothetical protein JW841_05425 [Deltaproteobacteria bacterium]|nr:hypothetical protein [Deltaproteobacteria bacterium]
MNAHPAKARLATGSDKLRAVIDKIKIPVSRAVETTKLREATLAAVSEVVKKDRKLATDAELKRELDAFTKATTKTATVGEKPDATLAEALGLDIPLAFHPEFRRDLDLARLYRLGDAVGINENTAKILTAEINKVSDITNEKLAALVAENKLKKSDAVVTGQAASLYNLLDERPELVEAAHKAIGGNVRTLVNNDKAAWIKIIKDSKTQPPGNISVEAYADLLEKKTKKLFPTDTIASALTKVKVTETLKYNSGLEALRELNPGLALVGTQNFSVLKTEGVAASELKQLENKYLAVVRLANRYAGMRLARLLDDMSLSHNERDREVSRRIELVNRFFADNEDVLGVDLTTRSDEISGLTFAAGASDTDKAMVLATARTYQRAQAVTNDIIDAESLVVGGYASAFSLAISNPETIAARTGLALAAATNYRGKAKSIATGIIGHAGTVIDVINGGFSDTAVGNISTEIAGYLKEIPGFADFFGNQSYCNCKHCQSILSPAAYFVDLMCFVDDNITQKFFASKPTHALNLKIRRPDLWTLELTCENTNKPIPYLTIINEVLENAVARDAGYTGSYADRSAVATKVYKDTLTTKVDSFKQPLHLPFEQLLVYLDHFQRNLGDLAEAGNATGDALARLRLSLPPKDYELITQENSNLSFLRNVYGIAFTESAGTITKLDAQTLLKPMGINRNELGELILTKFVIASGPVIRIRGEKRSSESIQNDIEYVQSLTRGALDRMHRFIRLWRATGWRMGELDLVLSHIDKAGIGSGITTITVRAVAHVHRLQATQNISVEELTALWSLLPRQPVLREIPATTSSTDDNAPFAYPQPLSLVARLTTPLFDRLFNQERFIEEGGTLPQAGATFLHPALCAVAPTDVDPNLHRLRAGLGVDEDQLLQLITGLAEALGIDLSSSDDNDKKFALSHNNLSLLYRHARLAKLLRVSIPELFALTALAPEIASAHIENLDNLQALIDLHAWWKTTAWSIAELATIVQPTTPALTAVIAMQPAATRPQALAQELVTQTQEGGLLIFADTVFAFLSTTAPGATGAAITEEQSRAIIALNPIAFEAIDTEGSYCLASGFDPNAALTLPPAVDPALADDLLDLVKAYHSEAILLSLLPAKLNTPPATATSLIAMLGVDLNDDAYFRELREDVTPPQHIVELLAALKPLTILFAETSVFDENTLEFVRAQAALFGISDFGTISTSVIRRIELFRKLVTPWISRSEAAPDLPAILQAFSATAHFNNANQEELAAALKCDVGLLQSIHSQITLSLTPFEALQEMLDAVTLAQHVGLGGVALKLVQSVSYDDLATASNALETAFRAKYENEDEWQKKIEPFRDRLLSRRRDGLLAYLVHSGAPEFDEVSDLYHYFLLDVELEGCVRTSRVASAIDSVQLYVHRCLMNFEETPPGHSNPVHVLPESIPTDEWSWRKNYRVWEANRKIFLYPENYIEPELRDNKTPLFKALEEDLLAKEVTNEAILEAYGRYLRGFAELSHLTIAGSYHEKDEDKQSDALHLFGVTTDGPPVYYYRRIENAHYGATSDSRATHYSPWVKLDIQIPVRKVSPQVHNGQLYIFWIRYVTRSLNKLVDSGNQFVGYQHRAFVEFSRRNIDGSWTTPQNIALEESPFGPAVFPQSYQDNGVILDPIVSKDFGSTNLFGIPLFGNFEPLYDDRPHEVPKEDYTLRGFRWNQLYPASGKQLFLRGLDFQLWSSVDLYRLCIGPRFELEDPVDYGVSWLNPAIFILIWIFSGGKFDLTALLPSRLVWSRATTNQRSLYTMTPKLPCFDTYTYASLLLDEARVTQYETSLAFPLAGSQPGTWTGPQWHEMITDYLKDMFHGSQVATVPISTTLDVVNGSVGDVIIQTSSDAFYLQEDVRSDSKYHLRRLNTSISEDIADILFNHGLEELLATQTQLDLSEHSIDLTLVNSRVHNATHTGDLDFSGPMGVYLREIFFHIPFLIANHLNSQGKYEEAQQWYHNIFDPTAAETITGLPPGLSAKERQRRELDRAWRYREFRGLGLESLRAQLTNAAAIEEYRRDPFNPHAIARLRLSAYQKTIIMKYVDNLLDWGDHLFIQAFSQLNPEYLREATLKYVTAQDILGERPVLVGDCGEGALSPKVFPKIRDALSDGSEFLMEMESIIASHSRAASFAKTVDQMVMLSDKRAARETSILYAKAAPMEANATAVEVLAAPTPNKAQMLMASIPASIKDTAVRATTNADTIAITNTDIARDVTVADWARDILHPGIGSIFDWGHTFVRQINPIFCVPGNEHMLGYWDRVADRLFKLRHCMDIEGVVRQLPLFAPPIDPGLLVGGKAAGLGLEDILTAAGGNLPPYRFRYLIDKAKGYTAIVQSFGGALLSAIEKHDAEELTKLRNVHQKNILALTTEVKKNELTIAEDSIEIINRRLAGAQYRHDYYDELISSGLSAAEITQTAARITASVLKTAASITDTVAGIAHLIPQAGSPFAMKYGGLEVGMSSTAWSKVMNRLADVGDSVALISGIVAGFERREEGWKYQKKTAEHDIKVINKELEVSLLRKEIVTRALTLHEKAIAQHNEVMEFYKDKFSNLGLYTHLSRILKQLFREAYNNALAMAKLAEQAYRFERPADSNVLVGGEWDASHSGLLAGERLMLALHNMERKFIETNPRQCEVNQSFSLAQIDPQALINLKELGSCEFMLPEFYFDLFYPGHYRRRIRGVRLTIPCITGPYTNVSTKLTLLRSFIRRDATLGAANLFEVPPNRTTSMATSTAQGDAGVFELNFRDERYMPFEGAGAVSQWRLELPAHFRPFDYQSINDVILNISYTTEEDGILRQQVESQNAMLEGSLLNFLSNNTLTRVLSLRQEFSSAFNRLVQAAAGTPVTIDIGERHFPLFLQGQALRATSATMVLVVTERSPIGSVSLTMNGTAVTGFSDPTSPPSPGDPLGGLPTATLGTALSAGLKQQHSIIASDAGNLAAASGSGTLFDPNKLRDILLIVSYQL